MKTFTEQQEKIYKEKKCEFYKYLYPYCIDLSAKKSNDLCYKIFNELLINFETKKDYYKKKFDEIQEAYKKLDDKIYHASLYKEMVDSLDNFFNDIIREYEYKKYLWTIDFITKANIFLSLQKEEIIVLSNSDNSERWKPIVSMINALYLFKALHNLKAINNDLIRYATNKDKEEWKPEFIINEFKRDEGVFTIKNIEQNKSKFYKNKNCQSEIDKIMEIIKPALYSSLEKANRILGASSLKIVK